MALTPQSVKILGGKVEQHSNAHNTRMFVLCIGPLVALCRHWLYTKLLVCATQVDRLEEARQKAVERWQQPVGALLVHLGATIAARSYIYCLQLWPTPCLPVLQHAIVEVLDMESGSPFMMKPQQQHGRMMVLAEWAQSMRATLQHLRH